MGNCLGSPSRRDSMFTVEDQVAIGHNQPLIRQQEEWSSEVPLTDGQLQGQRDTFWDTAPIYEGRKEIWDALRAACQAVEESDFELAQGILDGANINLPTGRLTEVYDELGNRYVIPKYCISKPKNFQHSQNDADEEVHEDSTTKLLNEDSPLRNRASQPTVSAQKISGSPLTLKVRLSTLNKDIKVPMTSHDRVRDLKRKLEAEHNVDAKRITMLYYGKVLNNATLLKDLEIPKGFVVQAVVT